MLSAEGTDTVVGDATFALYDNSVVATAATTFSRGVETLDGLGDPVAPNERRFGEELQYTPTLQWDLSERWEAIKDELFTIDVGLRILGSGWDHDGQTPLAVFRSSGVDDATQLIFLRGEGMEIAGTIPLNSGGFMDQLAIEGKRYRPETLIVFQGLVVIAAQRYETDIGPAGVDFFYTQDYGQTIERVPFVGGGFEVPAIEGGVTNGIHRLQQWSFLNAFPVNGIDDTQSAWFPWADYLHKGGTVGPKGGQIGLFRADRSTETGEWVLSPNRVVHSEWNLEDSGGFHAHAAAMTTGGVISHWGDVGYRNVTKFHQFDLNDYENATVTTTDAFGGSDFTAQEYHTAPQPVATAPSPVPGEHFASGDLTPEQVLSFGALANTGDTLEIEAKVFQAGVLALGNVHVAPELLHMHWLQGVGYVTGGRGDSYFYYSPDGYRWAEINSPEDQTGTLWIYGNQLLKSKGKSLYSTAGLPEIETIRPLQISPGGVNEIDSDLEYRFDPGEGNTRRKVLYQNSAWRYADTLIPLDVQAPAPHFLSSAPVYEITVGSESTNLGGWWLDPPEHVQDASQSRVTEIWVTNLADQSFYLGAAHQIIGDSTGSNAVLRYYRVSDTTQWLHLGASADVDDSAIDEGRFALKLDSFNKSPGSRFLVAIPFSGESPSPTYPLAAQASGSDESERISDLGFSGDWSVGLIAQWPQNSRTHQSERRPFASLVGNSGDAVEIFSEGVYRGFSRLRVDFYKAGILVHSESYVGEVLRGDWIEIVVSDSHAGTTVTFLTAGGFPKTVTSSTVLDLSLDEFQWAGRDGDTMTGIDPVLVVFDNDLAWDADQQKEWISRSIADKTVYQAKPALGDYNFDGDVDFDDFDVWDEAAGSTTVGQPGDFNLDGDLNFLDYAVWIAEFGQTGPSLSADINSDGVVDAGDYTMWRDLTGPLLVPGTGADGDHSGLVGLSDLDIWILAEGTHYPSLEELRAAASASTSSSASQSVTIPGGEEIGSEKNLAGAAFVLSPAPTSVRATRIVSRPTLASQDTAWELLAAEDASPTISSTDATHRVEKDELSNGPDDERESASLSPTVGQEALREHLIDEAIAMLTL